jgi:hypothetical protein
MEMGEFHESLEGTKNYYGGASHCFGQHCQHYNIAGFDIVVFLKTSFGSSDN